jgi:hypothetical protein
MALQFGVASLTVSGIQLARLMNVTVNITYDNALLRGDNRIFADNQQLYNGNIEGTFEVGEINITAFAAMMGADVSFAAGSGTITLTATQVLQTGADIIVSAVTNGVTGTLTMKNCKFDSWGITIDRENYTLPSVNFRSAGDANGVIFTWQI